MVRARQAFALTTLGLASTAIVLTATHGNPSKSRHIGEQTFKAHANLPVNFTKAPPISPSTRLVASTSRVRRFPLIFRPHRAHAPVRAKKHEPARSR